MAKGPESSSDYEDEEGEGSSSTTKSKSGEKQRAYTDQQLQDLKDGKTDKDELTSQKRSFQAIYSTVRDQLNKDDVLHDDNEAKLSKKDRKKIDEMVAKANADRNPQGIAEIKKHIDTTIEQSRKMMGIVDAKLEKNKDLLGKDKARNVDSRAEIRGEIRDLSLDEKPEAIKKLDAKFESLRSIRDDLVKMIGNDKGAKTYLDKFGKMKMDEQADYVKGLKENMGEFKKLFDQASKTDIYDEKELQIMSVRFGEAMPEDQKKMIKEMEQNLKGNDVKSVQDSFKKFSENRQDKYKDELKKARGLKAKTEVLDKMKAEIRKEAIEKWNTSKLQSPFEKSLNAKLIGQEQDPKNLEMSLAGIADAEKLLKGFEDKFKAAPAKVQALYDFDNANFCIHPNNPTQLGKMEIAKECEKHVKLIAQWETKLKEKEANGLVSTISAGKYRDKFAGATIKEKEDALKRSTLDDPRRQEALTRFKKLPIKDQEKHAEFKDLRLRDRLDLVEDIEQTNLDRKNMTEEYKERIAEKVDQQLLAPNSAKAYLEWFEGLETTDDMAELLNNSDLEDPRRQEVLDTFRSLPEAKRKENSDFFNQDLSKRIETVSNMLPEEDRAAFISSLNSMKDAKPQAADMIDSVKRTVELQQAMKYAEEFQKGKNSAAELKVREDIAKMDPENQANLARIDELMILVKPSAETMGRIIQDSKGDQTLHDKLDQGAILLRMADDIQTREDITKDRTLEQRTELDGSSDDRELSQEFATFTDNEMVIDAKTGMAQDVVQFKMNSFDNVDRTTIYKQKLAMKQERERPDKNITQKANRWDVVDKNGEHLNSKKLGTKVEEQAMALLKQAIRKATTGKMSPEDEAMAYQAMKGILLDNRSYNMDVN